LACLTISLSISLLSLLYPVYVIRPFRGQGPRELMVALAVLRYRPAVMVACLVASLAACVWFWARERRWLRRALSAMAVVAVGGIGLLSRVNIYELMFHPIGRPSFSAAGQTRLQGDEKVIAVKLGEAARAYPIRVVSYHHVVNDLLDGVPIVATY
jgi:hypothetical protein